MRATARRLTRSTLARNTGWGAVGNLANLAGMTVGFVLVARAIGVEQYGLFAGTVSLMLLLGPFTSVGAGHLVVSRVAGEGRELGEEIGRAWLLTALGGIAGTVVLLATSTIVLPQMPLVALGVIACSELVVRWVMLTSQQAALAVERLTLVAIMGAVAGASRLAAALSFVAFSDDRTAGGWAWFHLVAAFVTAAFSVALIVRNAQVRVVHLPRWQEVREGAPFSLSTGAGFLKNDIDKALLLRYGFAAGAGVYAAAYRVIGVALVPTRALVSASYARFFREGGRADGDVWGLALALGAFATVYGVVVAAVLLVAAPLLSVLLGGQYEEAESALRWLAALPLVAGLQMFAANALTGSGRHPIRMWLVVGTGALNLVLNLALIPDHSWRGAIVATLISEAVLVVGIWLALWRVHARRPKEVPR